MENSLQSVLEIIVQWNKKFLLVILGFFLFAAPLLAQQEGDTNPSGLKEKDRIKFNELFFRAEKEKNLGNLSDARDIYEQLHKMNPSNATVCYELARIYGEAGAIEEAILYGEKATSLDPNNKWFKLLLASIYREFGESEKEIAIFQSLAEQFPDNPDYKYELATAYSHAQEFKKAIAELNALEKILGINEVITDQKKKIFLEMGDLNSAAKELKKLIEAYPLEMDFYGTLGQMYQVNDMPEKAFEVYQEMLTIAPNDPRPHLDLAEYYRLKGDYSKSLEHLKIAMASPDLNIDQKIPVLVSLFNASERDTTLIPEAFSILEKIVALYPEEAKAFAIYGDFLSREGKNVEALKAFKKAVSLEGGNKFEIWNQILLIEVQTEMYDSLALNAPRAIDIFPNQPLPYFFAGVAFNVLQNTDEALYYLEEGLQYVLGNNALKEQFYTQLGDVYHQKKDHKKSDASFDKALALNANNATVLNNYAYYLSVRNEQLEKALEMTKKSNAISPNNAVFLDTYAWVLYKNGNYKDALEKIEKVVQLGGAESGEVREHYGDILLKNKHKEKALEQYQIAQKMGGASQEIDKKIKDLRLP